MNFLCCNLSHGHIQSTPWSLWNNVFSKSHISNHQIGPPCTLPPLLHYHFPGQKVSVMPHSWEEAASAQVGRREVVCESGAPCCWSRPPADERERERWRHGLITASWPRLLLQQREGERGKSPSPRQRQQQGCLYLCTPCSISLELSLNVLHIVLWLSTCTLVYVSTWSEMHIRCFPLPNMPIHSRRTDFLVWFLFNGDAKWMWILVPEFLAIFNPIYT